MSNPQIIHAACPHDCPDTCAMLVEVTDGRATKVSGDDAHPTTRGFLCTKVTRYLERVYHPRGMKPSRKLPGASATLLNQRTAQKVFCLTVTAARWASSRAAAWIGDSFTGWARACLSGRSARRQAAQA